MSTRRKKNVYLFRCKCGQLQVKAKESEGYCFYHDVRGSFGFTAHTLGMKEICCSQCKQVPREVTR